MGLFQIYHPEVFQGHLKKKNYFEGWFLKHCSKELDHVISVIPGIALDSTDSHAFIQIIDGISGETHYISYPVDSFHWDRRSFKIQVGQSTFSLEGIDLNIEDEAIDLKGKVSYANPVRFPGKIRSPGIMGWYTYVPFMECYHGIVSANHELQGKLDYKGIELQFSGGKGYIEKDWGISFPESWIWLQCNNFSSRDASLFISIAKIPWRGHFFMGFIAFLYLDGKFHQFSTYNSSTISSVSFDGTQLNIELNHKSHNLKAVVTRNSAGELRAPETGSMSRRIKESNDSVVEVWLENRKGKVIFHETGHRAGLEIMEKIFDYF